jgi:methyl-accepting chemotaxis protein
MMTNSKFINPSDVLLNELIVLEQNQLNISISKKLSVITHRFQNILRSKPAPMDQLLELYHDYLIFKEALELHFRKEQQILLSLTREVQIVDNTGNFNLNDEVPLFLKQPLTQLKVQLSGLTKKLNDIQENYQDIKNSSQSLREFFKDLENLALFLNVHRNLLKYKYYQKLIPAADSINYHLKAS